jgi:hypothetical protein
MNLSKAIASLGTADGVEMAIEPPIKTVVSTVGAAAQASASIAALATGKHVCRSIHASICTVGTAQTPLQLVLRDGATGAGTIKWSRTITAPVNTTVSVDVTGLAIPGSANTAMTLEFAGAGVAASVQDVTLGYVDLLEGQNA